VTPVPETPEPRDPRKPEPHDTQGQLTKGPAAMSTEPTYGASNVHLAQGRTVAAAHFLAPAETGPGAAEGTPPFECGPECPAPDHHGPAAAGDTPEQIYAGEVRGASQATLAEPHPERYSFEAAVNGEYPALCDDPDCKPCEAAEAASRQEELKQASTAEAKANEPEAGL